MREFETTNDWIRVQIAYCLRVIKESGDRISSLTKDIDDESKLLKEAQDRKQEYVNVLKKLGDTYEEI